MIFYITEVQEKLGYNFKDPEIIRRAFTHPSSLKSDHDEKDYDRYEFLGDSVLGFVVADYIFKRKFKNEGQMTEEKKSIVSSKPLSMATKTLGVEKYMLKSDKLEITDSMCENLFEAIIGAIYLDGGLEEARKFILKNLIEPFYKHGIKVVKDSKSLLNEYTSKNKLGDVKYTLVNKKGKDNLPTFTVKVLLNNKVLAEGVGNSKKNAEQMAAEKALAKLKKVKNKC